jgi:hypothetical protein
MASRILKGLAVAAGTGLAIGFRGERRRQTTAMSDSSSENIQTLEPLLARLDRIETRMSAVEASSRNAVAMLGEMLETAIGPHVENLRARLHAEMRE